MTVPVAPNQQHALSGTVANLTGADILSHNEAELVDVEPKCLTAAPVVLDGKFGNQRPPVAVVLRYALAAMPQQQ